MTSSEIKRIAAEVVRMLKQEQMLGGDPGRLLTLAETADMLRVSPSTFYKNKARLPYIKRGNRIYYREKDVLAYINR